MHFHNVYTQRKRQQSFSTISARQFNFPIWTHLSLWSCYSSVTPLRTGTNNCVPRTGEALRDKLLGLDEYGRIFGLPSEEP